METYSDKEIEKIKIAKYAQRENEKNGIYFCTRDDELYPRQLKNIKNPPAVIYYKGNIDIANKYKNIAVVGSRNCSENGRRLAYDTGKYVAEKNINVVNGLALGCDTIALRGALDNKGKCIVWLPCGLDNIQPKTNVKLSQEIIEKGGCLLSEYPIGTIIKKYNYVERDRLQSGISQGLIIVEAEQDSGTMHTAKFAISQYKRLACYYHKLIEHSTGNKYLEEKGVDVIKQFLNLENFINNISSEERFEQMTLNLDKM